MSRTQAVNYRLAVSNLASRLPPGFYVEAAYVGLQDTAPRDALLGMHARVAACEPSAWEGPRLIQTYSPRAAVYVLPREDFGVFTVGRLPRDPDARRSIEQLAEDACRALNGEEQRGVAVPGLRAACATGRIALRWTTSALYVREHPRPSIDPEVARIALCRRHVHAFGPTTPTAFAWWAGVSGLDAKASFDAIASEMIVVAFAGHEAWVLAADEDAVMSAKPMRGVRLLVAPDLRILGQDRTGLFVGPGRNDHSPLQDSFHPNGLLVDGRIRGAWGRRRGQVNVKAARPLTARMRRAHPRGGREHAHTRRGGHRLDDRALTVSQRSLARVVHISDVLIYRRNEGGLTRYEHGPFTRRCPKIHQFDDVLRSHDG